MRRSHKVPGDGPYEQAAAWHQKLKSRPADEAVRADFERWRAVPENGAAYASVARTWQAAGALAGASHPAHERRLSELLDEARRQRPFWRRTGPALAAASAVLSLALAAVVWFTGLTPGFGPETSAPEARTVYMTAVGERSTLTLDDGSQVALNTNSRLSVDFAEQVRRVILEDGQALFEVAHDASRPFVVQAGRHQVVALGTAFDVRVNAESVQVTLIDGSVRVEDSATAGAQPTRLDPGEQFVAGGPQQGEVHQARVEQVTSWRDGRLIFSDEPLHRAVAEVNRYSKRRIVLADEALAELRISGVFRTGRPDSFVDAVTSYFSTAVSRITADGDLVLQAAGG